MKRIFGVITLCALCVSIAAAEKKLFTKAERVTIGMTTNELVKTMGGPPASRKASVAGSEVWMWTKKRVLGTDMASFAVFGDRVVQTPIEMPANLSKWEMQKWRERQQEELRAKIAAIQKAKADAERKRIEDETAKGWREFHAKAEAEKKVAEEKRLAEVAARRARLIAEHPEMPDWLIADLKSGAKPVEDGEEWVRVRAADREREERRTRERAEEQRARNEKTETFLRSHPSLTPKVRAAIWKGEVCIGMPIEGVRFLWGEPENQTKIVSARGRTEFWHYGNTTIYSVNGVVESWQERK